MQRSHRLRPLLAAIPFAQSFVLAGCLAPPPEDRSGSRSNGPPDATVDRNTLGAADGASDSGPTEDATVDAPSMTAEASDAATDASGESSACGPCSYTNATASCSSGTCSLSSCNSGFSNCNGDASDGCEVNLKGTDGNNCGACSHSCLTGGSCSGGICQPIPFVISGTTNIVDLDTNGTIVVFADTGKQMIAEVDIPGGTPQMLAGNGQVTSPDHVAIDPASTTVYWTDSGNYGVATAGQVGSGSIRGTACGGAPTNAVANPTTNQLDVLSSALGTLLVGTGCVSDTTMGISGTLGASLSPRWVFGDLGASAVVFGGAQGPPSATIANQPAVNWVADDKTYGYWATSEPAIRRAPFNAPANVSVVLASPGAPVTSLATDGKYAYYGTSSGIYYVPVAGAASGTLLTGKPGTHIRYASSALFFLAGGVIYKIATPP